MTPFEVPGWVCPFCGADCSPISTEACPHLFIVDGENGWRFTAPSRLLHDLAAEKNPTLFRDLLYHDENCRRHLRLRRATYDDSLEMYAFSEYPAETIEAFRNAIEAT